MKHIVNDCFRNLLQPSGVMLRPAVFSLKVYRAEDIPQSEYCIIKCLLFLLGIGFISIFGCNYKSVGRCMYEQNLHIAYAKFPKFVKLST